MRKKLHSRDLYNSEISPYNTQNRARVAWEHFYQVHTYKDLINSAQGRTWTLIFYQEGHSIPKIMPLKKESVIYMYVMVGS